MRWGAPLSACLNTGCGPPGLDEVAAPQLGEHALGERFGLRLAGIELELGPLGRLVGGIDASEIGDQPSARLAVETLGIARLAHFERSIDENLDELASIEQVTGHAPLRAEGRDERHHNDEAGIDEEPRRLGHTANVLDPVGVGEAEILVEA